MLSFEVISNLMFFVPLLKMPWRDIHLKKLMGIVMLTSTLYHTCYEMFMLNQSSVLWRIMNSVSRVADMIMVFGSLAEYIYCKSIDEDKHLSPVKMRIKRCAKGTRRNPVTKICEKIN